MDHVSLAIPNVSEGRDAAKVARIAGARDLLDVHSDVDHNRSVLTYGGDPDVVANACAAMIDRAVGELDISTHDGVHPRYGAVDVLPLVAYKGSAEDARRVAAELTWTIAQSSGVPVHTYGDLHPERRTLPELRRFLRDSDTPRHPTAGVICMGIREPLVAFNVNVRAPLDAAKRIAAQLRALPGVRALGFALPSRDLVQVSMNLTELDATGPRDAYATTARLAAAEKLEIVNAEIVGLVPEDVLPQLDGVPLVRPARSIEQALSG